MKTLEHHSAGWITEDMSITRAARLWKEIIIQIILVNIEITIIQTIIFKKIIHLFSISSLFNRELT